MRMRITARRNNGGRALRQAMADEGIGLQTLAARTKVADPAGKGVSLALIGFLTQDAEDSRHARETTSPATADLIEKALGVEPGALFTKEEAPSRSEEQPGWDDLNVSAR